MPSSNPDSLSFTTEALLAVRLENEIATFWQQGTFSSFQGVDNKRINYAFFQPSLSDDLSLEDSNQGAANTTIKQSRKSIVIVSGRTECYLKYQELCFDLYQQGFDIFILDHRGQGLSERVTAHSQKGHVECFEYYIDDLAQFITTVVIKNNPSKPYLIGHSMGGAIVARYLQRFPSTSQAAILSSPMIGISSGGPPYAVTSLVIKTLNKINQWFGKTQWYFLGQNDYIETEFSENILMHSTIRHKIFEQLYQTTALQIGGVTVKWLREALKVRKAILNDIDKISEPVLVLQAGDEKIVDNQVQNHFCRQLHQMMPASCIGGKPITIDGAFHELYFETDDCRNQALTETLDWIAQH